MPIIDKSLQSTSNEGISGSALTLPVILFTFIFGRFPFLMLGYFEIKEHIEFLLLLMQILVVFEGQIVAQSCMTGLAVHPLSTLLRRMHHIVIGCRV